MLVYDVNKYMICSLDLSTILSTKIFFVDNLSIVDFCRQSQHYTAPVADLWLTLRPHNRHTDYTIHTPRTTQSTHWLHNTHTQDHRLTIIVSQLTNVWPMFDQCLDSSLTVEIPPLWYQLTHSVNIAHINRDTEYTASASPCHLWNLEKIMQIGQQLRSQCW